MAIRIVQTLKSETKIGIEGAVFSNPRPEIALSQAIEYAGKEGHVLSLPELAQARIDNPDSKELWGQDYTANSEEFIGRDMEGRFGRRKKWVYVVLHGGGIFSPARLTKGLYHYQTFDCRKYITFQESEITALLAQSQELNIFSYDDFRSRAALPGRFEVVLPYKVISGLKRGYQTPDQTPEELSENPLFIARMGGLERARIYAEKAKEVYSMTTFTNYFDYREVDDYCTVKVSTGNFLEITSLGGISVGIKDKHDVGKVGSHFSFIAVKPAEAKEKAAIPPLEVIMQELEGYISPASRQAVFNQLKELGLKSGDLDGNN